MSDDDLSVDPGKLRDIGSQLNDIAAQAVADTNKYFNSQADAAKDNPGFATGPELIEFANRLHTEINGFITDLSANAEKIVQAAQAYQSTDDDYAGVMRELSALNGQTKPTLPGR
ncbi:type VII secretion target [Nocardia terpenica]|uniref:PE domain-containing protein n=1 Tax=Nocardia terpenica TaxID=455432 RepID=A0A291RFL9_9NOCA|nr:type VII secretion target [Nocardia terpenica]ATL66376.1 hypothetical protein CRH09_09330 [Nocardia terpenica]